MIRGMDGSSQGGTYTATGLYGLRVVWSWLQTLVASGMNDHNDLLDYIYNNL